MRQIVKWLGLAAASGLFFEGLAWLLRVDLAHYVEMSKPSLAYCDRVTQRWWSGGAL